MKIKLNKYISVGYINWDDVNFGDVFKWKTKDDDTEHLGIKVHNDINEFMLDLYENELFEFKEGWYKVIEILDCTLVENYNE